MMVVKFEEVWRDNNMKKKERENKLRNVLVARVSDAVVEIGVWICRAAVDM